MGLKNFDDSVFNYKTLRALMMGAGSALIAIGPAYAYFIIQQVGFEGLGDALFEFITGVLAFPAGLFICITGKRLREPIMPGQKDKEDNQSD